MAQTRRTIVGNRILKTAKLPVPGMAQQVKLHIVLELKSKEIRGIHNF